MSQPVMWTYQDMVERLLDSFDLRKKTDRDNRLAREAVLNAYREMPTCKMGGWEYYKRDWSFHTEASYSTGTVAYTASTRVLTLTSGTWPANAAFGIVTIDNKRYRVESRTSSTVIVLAAADAPPADIAAGTSYVWFRESYPMPCDWRASGRLLDSDSQCQVDKISSDSMSQRKSIYRGVADRATWYSFENDQNYFNSLSITICPPPSTVRKYDFKMRAEGRPLVVRGDAGTATVPADSTTVTLATGSFDLDHAYGAVIRFSSSTTAPTSKLGYIANDNPYKYQRRLASITSATVAELDVAIPDPGLTTAVAVTVSDPIDVENGAMFSVFQAACDHEFAKLIRHKDLRRYHSWYQMKLREALMADQRDETIQNGYMQDSDEWGLPLGEVEY